MALPLIPIILAVASLGSGIVQGISSIKNANAEAQAVRESTQTQINERAKQARKLMSQQKTSFLKGGVYFDSGTPTAVINETYDTYLEDINAMAKDANIKTSNLERQGKTAFLSSVMEGIANGAMSFLGTSALTSKLAGATTGTTTAGLGTKVKSLYQNVTGKYTGGFTTNSTNKIV